MIRVSLLWLGAVGTRPADAEDVLGHAAKDCGITIISSMVGS